MRTILFVLCFLCGASPACYAESPPALDITTQDGQHFSLASLKGKVVIIHFWATWCSSCREEMPVLDNFYQLHHAQGVEVIAISIERPSMRDKVIAYMQPFHMQYALLRDAQNSSFDTPNTLPITYIIDTQGNISATLTPDKAALTQATLNNLVLPLLKKL